MTDKQVSQFTNGNTPNAADFVAGYLGASAGTAGANRRWSFTNIASRISSILALGTMSTQAASAVAITGGTIDNAVIGGSTPVAATFTTISATGDVTIANGKAVKTDTTTAHTVILQAYDNDNTTYRTFATLTNGNTPSFAITAPSGGTIAIDGAVIGANTPAAGTFTTLYTTGLVGAGTSSPLTNLHVSGVTQPATNEIGNLVVTTGSSAKRLIFGVDTAGTMISYIQSVENGVSARALQLQPLGGAVTVGGSLNTDAANTWTKSQYFTETTLTSSAGSIAWDLSTNMAAKITLSENTVLAVPSNIASGETAIITFTQGASAYTLGFNASIIFLSGTPTISVTAGKILICSFYVSNGVVYGTLWGQN